MITTDSFFSTQVNIDERINVISRDRASHHAREEFNAIKDVVYIHKWQV